MRKQRKKLKTPKTLQKRLKNDQKRLTLRKTIEKPEKRCPSIENRTVNKKTQKKIRKNIEKAKKKLKTPKRSKNT